MRRCGWWATSGRRGGAPHHARRAPATAAAAAALLLAAAPAAIAQEAPAAQAGPAEASPANPFRQRGVPAEATAENGVQAREQALANGRRAAWARVVAAAGGGNAGLGDAQIERMVDSIVIEEERVSPTRYSGRITVNFNPGRARAALGSAAAGLSGGGGPPASPGGGAGSAAAAPPAATAAVAWVEAVAAYRSLGEWLELQRRLRGAGQVASVDVQAVAVDRARLRLGLRTSPPAAAGELAGLGVAVAPAGVGPSGVEAWRVGLAGGG